MSFLSRLRGDAAPAADRAPDALATDAATETPVLDCVGAMLTCWARTPIILPGETPRSAERTVLAWRDHAIVGRPIPELHASDRVMGPIATRDWTALASLTSERRRQEVDVVSADLRELQRAVWASVCSVAAVANADTASDGVVATQLTGMQALLARGDTAAAVRQLPALVHEVSIALQERQARAAAERVALAARVDALGRALTDAEDLARTDPLTGVGNRMRFEEAVERALALAALSGAPASVLVLDVDGLKPINDTLGHAAGDAALRAIAAACWTVCTRATDVVCRLGGDEFAVVLPNTNARAVAALADRLERQLAETPVALADGVSQPVTASLGVATAAPGEGAAAWVARADAQAVATKRARGGGRPPAPDIVAG